MEERESVNARRRSFEELETSSHGALPRFQGNHHCKPQIRSTLSHGKLTDVPPAKRPKREEGLAEVRDDRRDRRGKQGNRRQPREGTQVAYVKLRTVNLMMPFLQIHY